MKNVAEHALTLEVHKDHVFLNLLKFTSALLPLFSLVYFPRFILSAEIMSLSSTALLRKFQIISGNAPVSRVVLSRTDQSRTLLKVSACLDLLFIFGSKLSFSFQ